MADVKETPVLATDLVKIEFTDKSVHNKPGTTDIVHKVNADKLVAAGVAKIVKEKAKAE